MSFKILGTGSCYPKKIVTNDDLSKIVETSDEWIKTRTSVSERRIAIDETITDLALNAAKDALENADMKVENIDLIICATLNGEYITPSLACMVQKKLCATCPAFDLNAACSGFVYALDVADSYIKSGKANNVLVIAAEVMSKLLDWEDRSTCVLFGDGAGAAVLTKGNGLLSIKLTAKGNEEVLNVNNINNDIPWVVQDSNEKKLSCVHMNGQEVYKFAVFSMVNDVKDVIEKASLTLDDIDFVLPHQANIRIIEAAATRLKIPEEKFFTNLDRFGNTSAASIAILLDEVNKEGKIKRGDILVLSAFGGGLTAGAAVIRW